MQSPDVSSTLGTVRLAVFLAWSSGCALLLVTTATSVVTSAAIAGQLLVGRELLDFVASSDRFDAGDLLGFMVALGLLLIVSGLSQALSNELRNPLGERVHRHTVDEILDVATEVDIKAYESAEFHDRLQRAQMGAGTHSSSVVFGLDRYGFAH